MAGQYWFPNMPIPEIMAALSEWGLSVSTEQLARPSSDFVTSVYTACLEQVTSIAPEVLHDPVQSALAALDDPNSDLYVASLAHNFLLYHLTRFANAARIVDFSARDLYLPDAERTRFVLSAFINFVKFAEQCTPFVANLRDQSTTIIDEREHVAQELAALQHKLNTLKAQRAKDEPKCDQLRAENAAITAHLMATKETTQAVVKDIEQLKVEKASIILKKENINSDISLLLDNIQRTRSRIVQSPERIKRNITTMGATSIEDKKTLAMHEAKARDLQAKIAVLTNIEKAIEKEAQLLEGSQKELADVKDSLDYKKIERIELQMKKERVHRQFANAQEKLERVQRHAEEKRQASQQTIERLQREYEQMDIERRDNDKHVEELRKEADDVEAKMAEHLKKSEAELNELLAEYWKLRHETVYMETLANKLNMSVTAD
ncbi:Nuf2 family-domain-containing protein [Boletus coccyginus]|nr:Nuf2 family-domain-containing protein [Boletus coccyginus]